MSSNSRASSEDRGFANGSNHHALRFLRPHLHLASVFGGDRLGPKAEDFARYFGTPQFLVTQTLIVAVWIGVNVAGAAHFDVNPFILLNLAFSLQAAYAAPLVLLAQTRRADEARHWQRPTRNTARPSPPPLSSDSGTWPSRACSRWRYSNRTSN